MTDQPEGFTLFSVLDGFLDAPDEELAEIVEQTDAAVADLADHDVTLRGMYDVSGLRADGTVMLWLHGPRLEDLQSTLRAPVSYTHLTLPRIERCRSRWSPYH